MSISRAMSKTKKFQFTKFDMEILKNFELIKQGAEAKVYIGKYDVENKGEDNFVLVKERFKKTYRHPDLDKSLTSKRIKNEVKLLMKANSLKICVPEVLKADLNNGIICMQYIHDSITCREFILNLVKDKESSVCNEILNKLSFKIGKIIGTLHLNEVIHGDLTTSNILIINTTVENENDENIKIYFIDFGLSSISSQLEEKAVDLYVLERALLSTHSQQAKLIFDGILKGYVEGHEKDSDRVIERFEQVRLRGRKRTMIG
jgi:TP53 regulating kinase-like protein